MDPGITYTCEYIFNELECVVYLNSINIDSQKYEFVYKEQSYNAVTNIKRVRKLSYINNLDLTQYANLMMIVFDYDFNQQINIIPNSVTHLIFGDNFNQKINRFPVSLTHLIFGEHFNQYINKYPDNIRHLSFGFSFNQRIDVLPKKLIYLIFGRGFYCEYDHACPKLPHGLTHLIISGHFNHKPITLSDDLIYLKLSGSIKSIFPNQPKKLTHLIWEMGNLKVDMMSPSLKILILANWYNYDLPRLPNLIKLICGDGFNHKLILPDSLCYLSCGDSYNTKIHLPDKLTHLHMGNKFNKEIELPDNLTHLFWYNESNIPKLPNKLIYLKIGNDRKSAAEQKYKYDNDDVFNSKYLSRLILPINSTSSTATLEWNAPYDLPQIPTQFTHLIIGYKFVVRDGAMQLPNHITHLTWNSKYNVPQLPQKLICLELGHRFTHCIDNVPKSIKEIRGYTTNKQHIKYIYNQFDNDTCPKIIIMKPLQDPHGIHYDVNDYGYTNGDNWLRR